MDQQIMFWQSTLLTLWNEQWHSSDYIIYIFVSIITIIFRLFTFIFNWHERHEVNLVRDLIWWGFFFRFHYYSSEKKPDFRKKKKLHFLTTACSLLCEFEFTIVWSKNEILVILSENVLCEISSARYRKLENIC